MAQAPLCAASAIRKTHRLCSFGRSDGMSSLVPPYAHMVPSHTTHWWPVLAGGGLVIFFVSNWDQACPSAARQRGVREEV